MTKAVCQIILHASTLSLIWRSIKALQQQRREEIKAAAAADDAKTKDHDDEDLQQTETLESSDDDNDSEEQCPAAVEMDMEILQLWALYAVHKIYVDLGVEWFASFLPLYYYFKMIILIVTIIPHTRFPNFWFDTILVPFMHKCHDCMDLDWRGTLWREGVLLPFRILDMTIMPGILCDDDDLRDVKEQRRTQVNKEMKQYRIVEPIESSNTQTDADDLGLLPRLRKRLTSAIFPGSTSASYSTANTDTTNTKNPTVRSSVERSRLAASSLHIRKLFKDHFNFNRVFDDGKNINEDNKKPDDRSVSNKTNVRTSKRPTMRTSQKRPDKPPLLPDTIATRTRRSNTTTTTTTTKSSKSRTDRSRSNSSTAGAKWNSRYGGYGSPDRNDTLSKRRRQREMKTPPAVQPSNIVDNETRRSRRRPTSASKTKSDASNNRMDVSNTNQTPSSSVSRSQTLSDKIRNYITGDPNIRLRDYLFDLNLPSPPTPTKTTDNNTKSPRVERTSRSHTTSRTSKRDDVLRRRRERDDNFKNRTKNRVRSDSSTSNMTRNGSRKRDQSDNKTSKSSHISQKSRTKRPIPPSTRVGRKTGVNGSNTKGVGKKSSNGSMDKNMMLEDKNSIIEKKKVTLRRSRRIADTENKVSYR